MNYRDAEHNMGLAAAARRKGGGMTIREAAIVHDLVALIKARLTNLHTYEREAIEDAAAKFLKEYR